MREELTRAMERWKSLGRRFHSGSLFPGGFGQTVHKVLLARALSYDGTGRLPTPAPPGGYLAPASAIGTAAAHRLSTAAPLWRFLAGELHGAQAVSLHQAPNISPEGGRTVEGIWGKPAGDRI